MKQEETKQKATEAPKIDMKRVGELMSAVRANLITVARFRFNMSAQDALNLLAACYQFAVERRCGTLVLDQNTTRCLTQLATYITMPNPKFGVMLCGTCGNGKTTMLYALQRAINLLERSGHFKFLGEYFKVGMEIVDVRYILQIADNDVKFADLRRRDMLAIDDMGKEPAEIMSYGNILNPVIDIIEHRYQQQLFTAITTNLTGKQIREKYGARIADRFNEMLEVIVFQDISYRH